MRLIVIAAVDQRAEPRHQLDHGHVKILTERVGRKHGIRHIGIRYELIRARLVRKVDARLETEVEDILELGKVFLPDQFGHLHKTDVAGVLDCFADRQVTVTVNIVALDLKAVDHQVAAAVERHIGIDGSCLQPGCDRKRLGCGTGLIVIADAEISPQRIEIARFVFI